MVHIEVFTCSWSMCDSVTPKGESACFQRETDAMCEVAETGAFGLPSSPVLSQPPVASGEGGSGYPELHMRNKRERAGGKTRVWEKMGKGDVKGPVQVPSRESDARTW